MPPDLQARISRLTRWEDRQASLLGRLLLVSGLAGYGYSPDCLHDISYGGHGRPYIAGGIDFNISHSGRYVVCCITDKGRVGVDIEEVRRVNIEDFREQMTPGQMADIERSENPELQFFKYWTMKESVIKADGRALNIPLAEITAEGNRAKLSDKLWFVRNVDIDREHECCVATETEVYERAQTISYSIDKVSVQHFETGGTFLNFNAAGVKAYFEARLMEGRKAVSDLKHVSD